MASQASTTRPVSPTSFLISSSNINHMSVILVPKHAFQQSSPYTDAHPAAAPTYQTPQQSAHKTDDSDHTCP